MSKKIYSKRILCFSLVFVVLLSIMSINVFAAEATKRVTKTTTQTITVPYSEIRQIVESIRSATVGKSTSSYDDGSYIGPVVATDVYISNEKVAQQYPYLTLYEYTVTTLYSGTATYYLNLPSKPITIARPISYTISSSQIARVFSSFIGTTFYYDDGTYRGTLKYVNITNLNQTPSSQFPDSSGYTYTFNAVYSGTVYKVN